MNCPRCQSELKTESIKERTSSIEVETCPQCKGIWFDQNELQQLEKIVEPVFWERRKIPKEIDQLLGLNCPICFPAKLMEKAEHPRDKKVIIDCCKSCRGIWLDKGEMEAIQKENILTTVKNLFLS